MNQAYDPKLTLYRNLQEILKVTVETTRKTLQCDRVIIYNTSTLPQAGVLAESVAANQASILGQTIKDPFLDGDYLEMYCYGMSVTIDDIYTSDQSQSDLQELDKLGIKSIAIAPIFVAKKLLAFLVAHQCVATKPWDLEVANFLSEQANAAGVALSGIVNQGKFPEVKLTPQIGESQTQQYAPTLEQLQNKKKPINFNLQQQIGETQTQQHPPTLKQLQNKEPPINLQPGQQKIFIQNSINRLLSEIKNKLTKELEQQDILDTTVAELRQLLNCDRVLIYSLDGANYGVVVAESVAPGWTNISEKTIEDPYFAARYLEKYRNGKIHIWDHPDEEDTIPRDLQQLATLEVKAGIVVPIANESQLFGVLIAHQCSNNRSWQDQEINGITEIANYIGIMLEYTKISDQENPEEAQQLAEVQKQIEKEMLWTEYFTHVMQQIRKSLKTEDILKTSVREVHTILDCDRVLIYALNQDSYGKIVAESVSPGWTKAAGRIIQDPCFEARYLEKYRDGRFRAWNDIYEAGMTNCHIEQLEQLEVRANLVVPIINEGKLFGLLVAHQCSDTRQWQQTEILWLTQIATQVGFALDNAQLLADAQLLRQQAEEKRMWVEHFTDTVQQIRQSLKTKDVLKTSVREVRRVLNCDRVVVYSLNQDNYGIIAAESVAQGWIRGEGRVIKDPCFEARYLDQYRDGRVRAWSNIYETGMSKCYVEQLEQLEVKANLVTPIINQGKLFGLLVAHQCANFRQWQSTEIHWLTQIATQVGCALENAQLLEQLEQSTKNIQEILARALNNSYYIQRTVQTVTAGLDNLHHSCHNFSETLQQLKDVSKQLAQQSMNMTRAVNFNQIEVSQQNSVVELSDSIFSLMQQLFEATAKIEPLFANIKAEITAQTTTLAAETQLLISGVDDFQTASQQIAQIVTLNHEMSSLMDNMSSSLETQIASSPLAQDSVHQLASITERISQQSQVIVQSFNQLALLSI